jgi:xylose isomerase
MCPNGAGLLCDPQGGGFTTGGTNFDAKLRRQSLDPEDLLSPISAAWTPARAA